jgi:hypothetical protein
MQTKANIAIASITIVVAALPLYAQRFTIPELIASKQDKIVHMVMSDTERLLPISELAARADIVVDARLVRPRSRLSDDQMKVFTDYEMEPTRVLRSQIGDILTSPAPGTRTPLLLAVVGGTIVLDGKEVRATSRTMKILTTGGRYLVFASRSKQNDNVLVPVGGPAGLFEVLESKHVNPMLRTSASNPDVDGVPVDEIVRKVQAAPARR